MASHRRTALLLAALAAVIAASLALRRHSPGSTETPDGEPPGWWRMDAAGSPPATDEAMARQLSLPYAAGVARPHGGRLGVVAWQRDLAQPGINLYVSGHGHEAILLAMDGRVLHRWRSALSELFPKARPSADNGFLRRAALLADGSLVALVQGEGLVRLDRDARVVWRLAEPLFNDLWVAPAEDRILTIGKRAIERPELREGRVLEDSIVTVDSSGSVVARASLLAAFERSPYRHLLDPLGPTADVLHANTIEPLEPGSVPRGPLATGRWLVSLREIDTVAVLDATAERVLWAQRGPYRRQHEPSLLPDGRLLLFDNRGGPGGGSRVLALDPASGETSSLLAGIGALRVDSAQAGACRRLGNGNLLVIASEQGVAWEIAPTGEIVWELRSPHRAGPRRALVAALFDVVRYERPTPFLARLGLAQAP